MPTVYIPGNRGGHNVKRNIPLTDPARDWKRITDHRGNTVGYFKDKGKIMLPGGFEVDSDSDKDSITGRKGNDDWMSSTIPEYMDLYVGFLGSGLYGYIDKTDPIGGGGSLTPDSLPKDGTHVYSITGKGDTLTVSFGPTGELQPQGARVITLELKLPTPITILLTWDASAHIYVGNVPGIGTTLQPLVDTSIPVKIFTEITVDTTLLTADSGLRI